MPVNVIEEEQEKLKEIVTKGMEAFQNGNADEALAIAEHAILTNPSYAEAYALKGLCHERKGAYAEALDAYETVVALNPDSTIDKIKLNQLRNAFAQRQAADPKPDRKMAGVMAVAATLLFASVGAVIYGMGQSGDTKSGTPLQNQQSQMPLASNQGGSNTNQSNPVTQPQTQPNNATNGEPGDEPALGQGNTNNGARTFSPNNGGGRRSSGNIRGNGFGEVVPFDVIGPDGKPIDNLPGVGPGDIGKKPPIQNPVDDPKPKPKEPIDQQKGGDDPEINAEEKGVYEISTSTKSHNNGGDVPKGNTSSSSSGKSYQREGQNHLRNGKAAEAKASLNKAKDAYEKDLASGKGDKEATQAALNSVNQALKNIKD